MKPQPIPYCTYIILVLIFSANNLIGDNLCEIQEQDHTSHTPLLVSFVYIYRPVLQAVCSPFRTLVLFQFIHLSLVHGDLPGPGAAAGPH